MSASGALLRVLLVMLACHAGARAAEPAKAEAAPPAGRANAEAAVLDRWRGTWEVKALRRSPQPAQEIHYAETFDWVLDGRFLRSQTTRKSDGGMSSSMFWFDIVTKTYRLVIYDAAGFSVELPPPTWNEATRTMEWKSGSFAPTSYTAHATFPDANTIRWKSLWKDWKGAPILELEGVSTRRP